MMEFKRMGWDEYFMRIAEVVKLRSHDVNTQMGCVIVDSKNRIVSTGYNGLPKGVNDLNWPIERSEKYYIGKIRTQEPRGSEWDEHVFISKTNIDEGRHEDENKIIEIEKVDEFTKYDVIAHAELNAIVSAGRSVEGCTLYVLAFPCNECAKAIIGAGIKKVIYGKIQGLSAAWIKPHVIAEDLFREAFIELIEYKKEDKWIK